MLTENNVLHLHIYFQQSAKAFDKKTSILLYVIRLIHRNDKSYLLFPNELSSCGEASRLTLDSAHQEEVG